MQTIKGFENNIYFQVEEPQGFGLQFIKVTIIFLILNLNIESIFISKKYLFIFINTLKYIFITNCIIFNK